MQDTKHKIHRGDVFSMELDFKDVEYNGKRRMYVVLSNNVCNHYTDKVTVAPLSNHYYKKTNYSPTRAHVRFNGKDSYCLTERVTTVLQSRLLKWEGRLSVKEMQDIDTKLQIALGIIPVPKKEMKAV